MSYAIVRVWVSRFKMVSPGHASLAIYPHSKKSQNGYISFAPVKSGSVYGPGKFYPLSHDEAEYMRQNDNGMVRGCWIGHIFGLDQQKMLKHFRHASQHTQTYSLMNECASQVHRYLSIGGGDKFASWWSRNVVLTWSPDDIEDYAKSIVESTQKKGSFGVKVVGAGTVF